jgi:ribose/xylose/arabinose/galactoside ABC-type transport system permease subunit
MGLIANGLVMLSIDPFWQLVVVGGLLLIVVAFDQFEEHTHE